MRKKRILLTGEFSKLNTGYACISHNLLTELYKSGKYEIFEFARYFNEADQAQAQLRKDIPWNVIGNMPTNEFEENIYKSNPTAEYGSWKFEQVCLDTQIDICLGYSDYWMDVYLDQSPFRRFYKTILMPTCDAAPQSPEWLDFYQRSDHIFTYTDWAYKVLQEEGGGTIPLRGVTTPAIDTNIYYPIADKRQHKANLGLNPDSFIIGMVARNQRRKRFPELANAFEQFVNETLEGTENTYLYFHTSFPDAGFDIPGIVKNKSLSRKILLTYFCHNCNYWCPSFYQDVRAACPRCGQGSLLLSNSRVGITNNSLRDVYNVMDLYVQFVTAEGLGIPQMEAAACGVPHCGTYYGGTTDLIDKLAGHPIPPITFQQEGESGREMAVPNVPVLVEYIKEFATLPNAVRANIGRKSAELCRKHYGGWQNMASKWMEVIDSIELPQGNVWTSPIDFVPLDNIKIPTEHECSDEQFVGWLLGTVLHRPEWINSFVGLRMIRDLSWGVTTSNVMALFSCDLSTHGYKPEYSPIDRQSMFDMIAGMRKRFNDAELARNQYILQGKIK